MVEKIAVVFDFQIFVVYFIGRDNCFIPYISPFDYLLYAGGYSNSSGRSAQNTFMFI